MAEMVIHKVNCLVLVTGHLKYAVDGYDHQAKVFLLNAVSVSRFRSVVSSIIQTFPIEGPFVFIKNKEDKERLKVYLDEIIFIEAAVNYVIINTEKQVIKTHLKLAEIEKTRWFPLFDKDT